ncbi:MAG: aminotransferase class I/II-fold pyridoxal phosphate-dependent enzyme [Bacteroidota bacterium]
MKKSICQLKSPLLQVLEAINHEPAGIAFIVDEKNRLCGVVTDGDVRRMLLAGRDLKSEIVKEDLKEFVVARQGEPVEELLKKSDKRVRVIPIVNENFEPVDYFRYEHRVHMMPVAEPDLAGKEFSYLSDAFLSTWISSSGKYITDFEKNFASYCGTRHGVAVSNGTVALHLAMVALGIGKGDEVIVPDLTFAATINTVLHANATPVIVDVEKDSWCIDPKEVEKAITPKTKAIIPVHLYGQPCDMDAIMAIAHKHNLYVIEDAAEAHGAVYNGKKTGSFGHISCFSFYGNKVITTGEGGMCLTNDDALNEKMRVLRDHGMSKTKKYWHEHVGFNYRMTNLQAAIGCAQLERIEEILRERKETESKYRSLLGKYPFICWQKNIEGRIKTVWLVSVLLEGVERELVFDTLSRNGVDVRPFFYSLSSMDIYKPYSFSSAVSRELSAKGMNLPTIKNVDFGKIDQALAELKNEIA